MEAYCKGGQGSIPGCSAVKEEKPKAIEHQQIWINVSDLYLLIQRFRLTWRLQESLEDMEYADDVCLVSHKYEHMCRKLDDLWKESKKADLEINSSKTEEIRVTTIQA